MITNDCQEIHLRYVFPLLFVEKGLIINLRNLLISRASKFACECDQLQNLQSTKGNE